MFCRLLKWTLCLLGLLSASTASPEDEAEDFGGESGSGMLFPGEIETPGGPAVKERSRLTSGTQRGSFQIGVFRLI